MEREELKANIAAFVREYVARYPEDHHVPRLWRTPEIGFADAYAPYVQSLPHLISDKHRLPRDFLKHPSVVICYFLPFRPELARTNAGGRYASPEWAESYEITNTMISALNHALSAHISAMGWHAAVPEQIPVLPDALVSTWSQRHLAYAAGLGTFGVNNMLITKQGCCGRFGSIVSDIPVPTADPVRQEYCLYKARGVCLACVKNCVSGALTADGFDRWKCRDTCEKNMKRYGVDVCGKCDVNIPCAFAVPTVRNERKTEEI